MTASLVTATTIQKKIARLTLNNAKTRNALSYAMLEEVQTHLKSIEKNPDIRVVIVNASGPAFSSGHDLQELRTNSDSGSDNNVSLMNLCSSVMQTVVRLKNPVIAQVDGIRVIWRMLQTVQSLQPRVSTLDCFVPLRRLHSVGVYTGNMQ